MKRTLLFCLFCCWPLSLLAQTYVNPDTISRAGDIYLQSTDVYYSPMAPPDPADTRAGLSSINTILTQPNGTFADDWRYEPTTHGVGLRHWRPYGTDSIGPFTPWMRLFTAKRKADGSTSDIVIGSNVDPRDSAHRLAPVSRVIIGKNEDVDFRASGTIKLKSGFHVKPGSFFHAYTEPRWDTTVFSDEFDSSHLDRSKWYVSRGIGDVERTAQCSFDSNVRTVSDTDAHDGHALDIILREDSCSCYPMQNKPDDNCMGFFNLKDTTIRHYRFSTANIRSCPMPWLSADSPFTPWYQHAPYGKYEIREKIPHIMHHTNDWGWNEWEWDMGETAHANDSMKLREIGFVMSTHHGPYNGMFGSAVLSGVITPVFRSRPARFSSVNMPDHIYINNFPYSVLCYLTPTDTFLVATVTNPNPFPTFLTSMTDSVAFDYDREDTNTTDALSWNVHYDYGHWSVFRAPYRVIDGIPQWFSKAYQPTKITLTTRTFPLLQKTFDCHWDQTQNTPIDSGYLWLDGGLDTATDVLSNTESYSYHVEERPGYPTANVPFDGNDTAGGYVYHTYTMELLPHELRYLIDGDVVRRFPDRLVPHDNMLYDIISKVPRNATFIDPAEFGIHYDGYDPMGDSVGSSTYMERHYFEHAASIPGWPGMGVDHAAHHLIDYVKVWDVPKNVTVPNFPY